MGRPSRKLPISRAVGSPPDFVLTDVKWKEVEAAYKCMLSDTIRHRIVKVTREYLASEVFERNARPSKQAIDMIEAIKAASDNLRKKLSIAGGEAGAFVQSVVKERFFSHHFRLEPFEQIFHGLGDVMFSLNAACTQALTELDDPDAKVFHEDVSWQSWIRALTNIAEQNGLAIAAPKAGNSKTELGPFARFVEVLQEHLPKEARRHANTRLSSAIYQARRQSTEKIEELE